MTLTVTPVTLAEANKYIAEHHRHHKPVVGHLVCCAVSDMAGKIRGVGIAGRPVSRMLQDGFTAEVTRCCSDGTRNACSMLYRALWRAVRALGYRRLVTYTLPQEGGASLRGAGFKLIGEAGGSAFFAERAKGKSLMRIDSQNESSARVELWTRGFFGVGIVGSKTAVNVGTLWRSADALGAGFMFTAGRRYPKQASDTVKAWKHTPFFEYENAADLFDHIPKDCVPVAVELDSRAKPLARYTHPERAVYLLGAEDNGLPLAVLERCRDVVQIPGAHCLNVAVAGSIVLYDRVAKAA